MKKIISNEKISNIKKMTLFLLEYSYILFAIYAYYNYNYICIYSITL